MIDVDRTTVATPAEPRNRRPVRWITVLLVAIGVMGAAVPWERWCSGGGDGFRSYCFNARIWSGSASLYGLLAMAGIVVFVALALGRRWISSPRLSTPALTLIVGITSAATIKLMIAGDNSATYTSNQSGPGPAFAGMWLTLVLVIALVTFLLSALIRQGWRLTMSWAVVVAAVVIALAIPYARSGLAWWGGPMSPPGDLGGGNGQGFGVPAARAVVLDKVIFVSDGGHVTAVLDGIDAVDRSPEFQFGPVYVLPGGCYPANGRYPPLPACASAGSGYRFAPGLYGTGSDAVAAVVRVPARGPYRVGWFRIRYHVGPLHFERFETMQLVVCGLTPGVDGWCPTGTP